MCENYNRNNFCGNLLKAVVTRIDFEDLIELKSDTIKEIKKIFPNELNYRMLKENDFYTNDPINIRNIPNEIIEKTKCYGIFLNDNNTVIEINQFFFRIVRFVKDGKYSKFEDEILKYLKPVYQVLHDIESIDIIRISVKKSDEVFFKSISKAREMIANDILQPAFLKGDIDITQPHSKYTTYSNFLYKNSSVNFHSRFEKVKHKDKGFFRLYLEYENYLSLKIDKSQLIDTLVNLNQYGFELFAKSFKKKGYDLISRGERIGEYELN